MGNWDNLSLTEKAAMMRVAVKNGITNLQDIKREYNEFAKGGPKKKAASGWYQQHQNRWYNFLRNKGLSDADSARLSGFFTAQDDLESAGGKSNAAREKNNFGGMQRGGKNIRYNTVEDYMQDKWKMMNSKFKSALGAKNIDEYATILGNPETAGKGYLYYVTDKVKYDPKSPQWKAAQRQHMQNYINGMRSRAGMGTVRFNNQPIASAEYSTTPINPSISQESLESPIPFTPFNPEAFFATPDTYQQPIVVEEPEAQEPVVISPYSPEEIERQERMNRLSTFNRILSLTNPYPQEEDSFLSTVGLLTGNTFSKGGKIYIKPSHRGRLTELKKRTGKSEAELYKTGGPAVRKMITFARNARKWKHGLGGNLYDDGGSYFYTKPLDNVFVDDEGNLLDPDVPSARGTVQLPEIIVSTRDPRKPVPTAFSKDLNDAIFNISRHLMQYGRNKSVLAPTNTEFNIIDNEPIESMAQATYLTPRNIQKQKFLEVGYTEAPRDYGLVKKAVGDRNIPVYQKRPDDEKRENLIAIGNIDTEWFGKDRAELRHAGSYPTAVYINPENSKVYQKAWDLNDYGGNTGTAKAYSPMRKLEANVIDKIGSPVVVTSGISEVDNENIRGSLESVLDDFMHNKGLTRYRDYIKEEIPMNNIHGEPMYNPDGTRVYMTGMKPFTYYGLPEVTVYGKMKKGTTYLLTPSIISKKK